MFPRVSTEVAGWREALSDRVIVLTLVRRVAFAVFCTAAGLTGGRYATPPVVLLAIVGGVLLASLVLLRVRGRP